MFNDVSLNNDRITMTQHFFLIKNFIDLNNLNEELKYELLKNYYSKACMFVHGNPKADYLNILFFDEINKSQSMKKNKKVRIIIDDTETLFKILIILFFYKFSNLLSTSFLREKYLIQFYTDSFCYNIVKYYKIIKIKHYENRNELGFSLIVKNKNRISQDKEINNYLSNIKIQKFILFKFDLEDFKTKINSEFDDEIYFYWKYDE